MDNLGGRILSWEEGADVKTGLTDSLNHGYYQIFRN